MNLSVVNSVCYTAGWFWSILLGIHGHSFAAVAGALLLIIFQLYLTRKKEVFLYIQDAILLFFSLFLGLLLELIFVNTELIQYKNLSQTTPPIWVVILYPLFSLLLNHSLRIMKKSYFVAFLFGLIGAPLSYLAGRALGGLTFPYSLVETLAIIGVCWGLFLCLLVAIANSCEKAALETLRESSLTRNLRLLYDGDCPICQREICMLQKKDRGKKIHFVDISSKEYSPEENGDIDFNRAMSQIHAIDEKGNVLVGIPVFAAIYASCELLLISTLLRLPFINIIARPLYTLFAKNRLWITGRKSR